MSNLSDALKASEVDAAKILENILFAGLKDLVAALPVQYQALALGLDAALEPAVKAFIDSQIAKLGVA